MPYSWQGSCFITSSTMLCVCQHSEHTEGRIFEARVDFDFGLDMSGSILIVLLDFQLIMMVLVVWARCFNSD